MQPFGQDFALDASVLALALLWDIRFGEMKRLHPVAAMGKLISFIERWAPTQGQALPFVYGLGMATLIPAALVLATFAVSQGLRAIGSLAYLVGGAYLLKSSFAVSELGRAALRVCDSLEAGRWDEARQHLASLVSRDTSGLSPQLMASAAVESVAENTTDSFVAPWLAFAMFGLPGAVSYRAINTLDSMIGYHGRYEYLGRAVARLDDIVNWLPARLAALLIVAAACFGRRAAADAWRVLRRDRQRTESPNAGWTMSGMAGALGVELEKVGHYRLGIASHPVGPADIREAVRLMRWVAGLSFLVTLTLLAVRYAIISTQT